MPDGDIPITLAEMKGYYENMGSQPVTAADIVRVLETVINALNS